MYLRYCYFLTLTNGFHDNLYHPSEDLRLFSFDVLYQCSCRRWRERAQGWASHNVSSTSELLPLSRSSDAIQDAPIITTSLWTLPPLVRTFFSTCALTVDALTCKPAATVPHRRQISFWAKANSFKNPILRFILVSSGAIPVHRNPNNVRDASISGTGTLRGSGNDSLFLATSRALAGLRPRGGLLNRLVGMFPDRVVGVFPEGTSYTEPCIIQVKEGAAWVALEYSRWMRQSADSDGQPIKIIPVGIAYTDKTQYLSRVSVR